MKYISVIHYIQLKFNCNECNECNKALFFFSSNSIKNIA